MSNPDLTKFFKALDNVKKDLTCGVCSELCSDPVTLSVCFHSVCSSHIKTLKNCPECNITLDNCKTFVDEGLRATIPSTKALIEMFKPLRKDKENTTAVTISSSEKTIKRKAVKNTDIADILLKIPTQSTSAEINKKPSKNAKENERKNFEMNSSFASLVNNMKGKGIHKRNTKGETALHVACRLGKADKVLELLEEGANPNTVDNAGWTPLHEVVQNGNIEIVRILLQHNALINVPGQSNETPLHEAIRYQHLEIIEELVKNGADVDIRNIKGETPLELASGDTKTVIEKGLDNIIQTQSINIAAISNFYSDTEDEIHVYLVSQSRHVQSKLKLLSKHHSNIHIEAKFVKKVTHLIVDTEPNMICNTTVDVLQGVAFGLWILSSEWLLNSTEEKLLPFSNYEVKGINTNKSTGPKVSRFNKYKQLPGLFSGCHFYLHNFNTKYDISKHLSLTKAILTKLITDAGGIVLRRVPNPELIPDSEKLVPYHARKESKLYNCSHYIIYKDMYEPLYNMSHLKALPVGWLIECLEKYELCDPW